MVPVALIQNITHQKFIYLISPNTQSCFSILRQLYQSLLVMTFFGTGPNRPDEKCLTSILEKMSIKLKLSRWFKKLTLYFWSWAFWPLNPPKWTVIGQFDLLSTELDRLIILTTCPIKPTVFKVWGPKFGLQTHQNGPDLVNSTHYLSKWTSGFGQFDTLSNIIDLFYQSGLLIFNQWSSTVVALLSLN